MMQIELDRTAIQKYEAWNGFGSFCFFITIFSFIIGVAAILEDLKTSKYNDDIISSIISGLIIFGVAWIMMHRIIIIIGYYGHWRYSKKYAETLSVSIEGPFLRIIECRKILSDRKIHFNQLMDYTIIQDKKMKKLNIKAIRIDTNQIIKNGPQMVSKHTFKYLV